MSKQKTHEDADVSESFVELLDAEIERQKNLIERMDNHPDINTGIMGDLRAEKLELMTRLRKFYRKERPCWMCDFVAG